MPKYPGISPYDNEKGTLGTAKKRWEKLYVKEIESDTVSGINATIENLATTATNSVSAAVSAKNDAVAAKTAAEAAQTAAETAAAGIQSVVETDVDNTLSIAGVAADAKVTGDWLRDIAKPVTLDTSMPATAYADEYMKVTVDSDNRVLYGVKRDGSFYWQKGVPQHVVEACNPTMDNPEWLYLIKDPEDKVLFGIKRDGTVLWPKGTPQHVIDACNPTIENDEFVQVVRDYSGRMISAVRSTGEMIFYTPVTLYGDITMQSTNALRKAVLQYDKLKGKKVSIIGDSISTFEGYSGGYYPAGDVTDVNDTWWMQVINNFDMELLKNVSFSSSTVTGDSTVSVEMGRNTPGCCDYRINALAQDGVTPDIVLIYIGVNDRNRETTTVSTIEPNDPIVGEGVIYDFAKAYDLMLYKIKSTYPNATVYCASMPYRVYPDTPFPYCNKQGISDRQLSRAIMQAAEHIGANYVDFYSRHWNEQSGFHGPHLLKSGMTMLARTFIKKIESTY